MGAGLSQRELARRSGWNYSLISKLENGARAHVPDEEALQRLDDALGADGQLLRIAGYQDGYDPDIAAAVREVVDQHIRGMVDDLQKLLGR